MEIKRLSLIPNHIHRARHTEPEIVKGQALQVFQGMHTTPDRPELCLPHCLQNPLPMSICQQLRSIRIHRRRRLRLMIKKIKLLLTHTIIPPLAKLFLLAPISTFL